MNVVPKGASASDSQSSPQTPAQSARERAIAKLMGNSTPVPNPTSIAPEEMGAVSAPKSAPSDFEKAVEEARSHTSDSEPSSEARAETKAKEEPISSQYAVLARKEKAIRQREQQLKAREAAIKAQEEASKAAVSPPKPAFDESKYVPKDRLTTDPFSVLGELGLSYDQLAEMAMNAPKAEQIAMTNELKALREELQALKSETETTKKSLEEQQSQSYKQAIDQIRNEAKVLITRNPNFETIRETRSLNDVVELIETTFKEDGILLTVEEAAQQVEDYLVEEATKIAKIKKIQQRLAPKTAPASKPVASGEKTTGQPKQSQPLKTLTNSVSTSRPLTARERALLAFEGKLNK